MNQLKLLSARRSPSFSLGFTRALQNSMTICTAMGQQPQQQQPSGPQQQQRPPETQAAPTAGGVAAVAYDEVMSWTASADDPKSQVSMGVTTEACNIPNCVACNGQEECLACVAPLFLDRKRAPREGCVTRESCTPGSRAVVIEGNGRICLDSSTSGARRIRLG